MDRGGVRPSPDAEQNLKLTVLLLEVINGLEVAVEVVTDVIPGIAGVMDVLVRPQIGEVNFSSVRFNVGKCV